MKKRVFYALVLALTFLLASCGATYTMDLTNGFELKYQGTEGEGKATVSTSAEVGLKHLDGLMKAFEKNKSQEIDQAVDKFVNSIHFTVQPNTGLKDGDKVKVNLEYDKEAAKKAGIQVKFKETEVEIPAGTFPKIETLTEEKLKDAFQIEVNGIYPDVDVRVSTAASSPYSFIQPFAQKVEPVSPEEIHVKVKLSASSYELEQKHLKLATDQLDYTVSTKSFYISELKQIPKADLQKMVQESKEQILSRLENKDFYSGIDPRTHTDPQLVKGYLQVQKGTKSTGWFGFHNRILFVYETKVSSAQGILGKAEQDVPCYFVASQSELVLSEGKFLPQNMMEKEYIHSKPTEDKIKTDLINKSLDKYSFVEFSLEDLKALGIQP